MGETATVHSIIQSSTLYYDATSVIGEFIDQIKEEKKTNDIKEIKGYLSSSSNSNEGNLSFYSVYEKIQKEETNRQIQAHLSSGCYYPDDLKNGLSTSIYKISEINFNYREDEINLQYFLKQYKKVSVKSNHRHMERNHFHALFELQTVLISKHPIWSMKMSYDGHYIAFGDKIGRVTVLEVIGYTQYGSKEDSFQSNDLMTYLQFLKKEPIRKYNDHSGDITDLAWSQLNNHYLLTASVDFYVFLYDVKGPTTPLKKFKHEGMVTCVDFFPFFNNSYNQTNTGGNNNENSAFPSIGEAFVSGCLDKYVRVWSTDNDHNCLVYFNLKDKITAITFAPSGDTIITGTHNGKVVLFYYDNEMKTIKYDSSFTVKNKHGANSNGKKINNIHFISKFQAYITTCDSRIRLVSFPEGRIIHKYKGHTNKEFFIRCNHNDSNDILISGSEDGSVIVWNKESSKKKNYAYEVFKSHHKVTGHNENSLCTVFANELSTTLFSKKIYKISSRLFVYSIIITGTSLGNCRVLLNIDNIKSNDPKSRYVE